MTAMTVLVLKQEFSKISFTVLGPSNIDIKHSIILIFCILRKREKSGYAG